MPFCRFDRQSNKAASIQYREMKTICQAINFQEVVAQGSNASKQIAPNCDRKDGTGTRFITGDKARSLPNSSLRSLSSLEGFVFQ